MSVKGFLSPVIPSGKSSMRVILETPDTLKGLVCWISSVSDIRVNHMDAETGQSTKSHAGRMELNMQATLSLLWLGQDGSQPTEYRTWAHWLPVLQGAIEEVFSSPLARENGTPERPHEQRRQSGPHTWTKMVSRGGLEKWLQSDPWRDEKGNHSGMVP